MIRPVTNIDNVYITDQFEPIELKELERAGISRNTMRRYEAAINPKVPFRYRLQQFMRAENDLGRIAKVGKDLAVFFLPWGKKIETATDIIDHLTQKEKPMDKPRLLSKTVWGAILLALTSVLQALGVDVISDPVVMENVYHIMYGLAGFLGLFGLREAVGKSIGKNDT